jgi:hypothetical protein
MKILRFASAAMLAALVSSASAQIIPAPLTATVVNFDDLTLNGEIPFPIVTDRYTVSAGVTFAGFGQNSGGLFNPDFGTPGIPAISPPNVMYFVSAFPVVTGGLAQSPETLTFYPAISHFQFDTSTLGADCEGTMVVFVNAFDADGNLVGSSSTTATSNGETISLDFATPATRVVVSSTHTCGTSGLFVGVEVFSMDNVAFVPVAQPASRCVQSILDAAGKKAKAQSSCYAKALQNGVEVDAACLQKATDGFTKSFNKAQGLGDCQTDADVGTVESAVDSFTASAVQEVTGGAPGPDVCFGKKVTSIGKKAQSFTKCFSTAAKKGTVASEDCAQKAAKSFNSSLKQCGTPTQLKPIEELVDQFGTSLARTLTVPTTTTTTTTTSTTTSTTAPPLGQHLAFTTTPGTANCTIGPTNDPPTPAPPLSGEIDADTAGTTKISDLGLGCLYIGGGAATVAPSQIPENATTILDSTDGMTLTASFGTGRDNCSRGPVSTAHCLNDPTVVCTSDGDCTGLAGSCAPDAACFFGPPIPINGFPPSCVVNTFASDASGTLDLLTGASSVSIALSSRVYLTLGSPTNCPICDGGACNYGANAGQPCTTNNVTGTSNDCIPNPGTFVGAIPVNLSPLTTGTITQTAADGNFCSPQQHPGAFGQPGVQAITQHGMPAGDSTDGLPHESILVSTFCIPATGSTALDSLADLPGPGSLSLPGEAQFFASPSGAFLAN